MDENAVTISGTVENIVFQNSENGWTVLELDDGSELITAVGILFQVCEGDKLKVMGEWTTHRTYGRQFKVSSFEKSIPATEASMLKYLASGAVKGIGPAIAQKIIDKFGAQTLNIIENEPIKLSEIKGISKKKAEAISDDYKNQFGVRSCMLFFQQYGVTPAEAVRIWQHFGSNAVELVKVNPYILCDAGIRISFERADAIAAQMGFTQDTECRIRAGILHILLHNLYSSGHTYIPDEKLVSTAEQMLNVKSDDIDEALEWLCDQERIDIDEIDENRAIFIHQAFLAETYIAGRISLMQQLQRPQLGDCEKRIDEVEQKFGIEYAGNQRKAIETAYSKGIMILTGGPGTGKTTTINAIIEVYEKMGLKVALAAPTGRAAKRMTEVSGKEAKTIHRLLEVQYTKDDVAEFARNERNPLDCDALIVDELSMVDVILFEALLRALRLNTRLVLVGDANQLPPVGAGNVLRDLIETEMIPVVKLDQIFRQAAQSLIVTNAHKIVRGEMPDLSKKDGDFFFMPRFTPAQVSTTVTDLIKTRLPKAYDFSSLWDIQILTPGRKGELGANELNVVLQEALNPASPEKPERTFGLRIFRQGDKVMQIKNNYDISWTKDNGEIGTGIFNGDVGVLESIDKRLGIMKIRFDDRIAEYPPEGANELDLAYAVTVHKSQGSEFKAVILPLFSGAPQLFYRNLLYTAVTRAKQLVIIVGRSETVERMVECNKKMKRYTGLCDFIKNGV